MRSLYTSHTRVLLDVDVPSITRGLDCKDLLLVIALRSVVLMGGVLTPSTSATKANQLKQDRVALNCKQCDT